MDCKVALLLFSLAAANAVSAGIISGKVTDTSGAPVAAVPVSDGYTTVLTAADGRYSFTSDKTLGLVFISTPSGYEPATAHGNRPDFWQLVTSPAEFNETADFVLSRTDDSRFAFVALADNQLTNRPGEVDCFKNTTVPDVNATLAGLRAEGYTPFIITLGDQAHDCYWKQNRYGLPEAYSDLEKLNARLYSVIGNHDHDPTAMNDIDAGGEWRRHVGPSYYSFNKGGTHFIVLDDVTVVDNGPTLSKDGECVYKNVIPEQQMKWLRDDLALINDKGTPIVIAMHSPLYYFPGSDRVYYIENGKELVEALDGFENVEVISGHTHVGYATTDPEAPIHETNYGAVCGSWWLNARVPLGNDNNLCRDGTPSGYAVWKHLGNGKFSNYYKGTGLSPADQFRAYDLNLVEFDNEQIAPEFAPGREKANEVMVNVWSYGPGWTVEMSENGRPLEVERVRSKDPLFLISCPIPYVAAGHELIGTVRPVYTWHMFKAKASAPDTPIDIKVTDHEGRVYERTFSRPHALTTDLIQ